LVFTGRLTPVVFVTFLARLLANQPVRADVILPGVKE
jgi:hypothetical protein